MANLIVNAVPSNTNVSVQDANNLQVSVTSANDLTVEVVPVANQIISIDKGRIGPPGPPGPNTIGGYPISIMAAQNYDALMFFNETWVNIPQTEISDGGNF